jgi:excisionase family DNA binding protein
MKRPIGLAITPPTVFVFPTEMAASYCGLAVATLEKLRLRSGGPAFLKLGRSVRYRRNDLDAWLESRRVETTSQT